MYRDKRLLYEKAKRNTIVLQSIPLSDLPQESIDIKEYTQLVIEVMAISFGIPWYFFYSPGEILAAIMAAEKK